ncbi:MAG: peptidyl-prolyl cis-trans isomerase [Candidatus Latescibacteria bacterium]|nr:peptidyl-prolyl cis-trans isomerase [Candidatus Latescibacterota bacterium]
MKSPSRFTAARSTVLIGIAFTVAASATTSTPPAPGVVGLVDGIPISQIEWDRMANPYFEEVKARAGRELTADERALLRKNILDELIRERLWVADSKRRGFAATQAEIDAHLSKNPYFRTNGKFDDAKFRDFKTSPSSNYPEIREQLENAVLLDKYVRWMDTRYAPREPELKREFAERTAQASLRFFWLTTDAISLDAQAGADEIRAYYEAHPDEFATPEQARITYIRVPIEAAGSPSDSARPAGEAAASAAARALLVALKAGRSPEDLAAAWGGVKDPGLFKVGDPIKGLGRSDALADAIRSGSVRQWLPEPIRMGSAWILARLEERREPAVRPFREVVGLAKRRADAQRRESELDSLARAEYQSHTERYRTPYVVAAAIARALASFDDERPVSERDVRRALERLRKAGGYSDTARAWADSVLRRLPETVQRERRLAAASKSMRHVMERLKRGEPEAEVARRHDATLIPISMYRGQPPAAPSIVEGPFLDSLYRKSPGAVVGPRVARDSMFVVRVSRVDDQFLPPFEAARISARFDVDLKRARATEREAEAYFSTRRERHLTPLRWGFDFVRFVKMKPDSAPVPGDSIKSYYDSHAAEFTVPAKARARHILISSRQGDAAGVKEAARKKALDILKRIKEGEDLGALARQFSEDRGSAPQGGDLGEITRGEVVKEFGDATFGLEPGQVSEVVETQFGFHIIKLESMSPQRLRPLEECRSEIQGVLGLSLADSLALAEARGFAADASRPGASFEALATRHGGMTTVASVGARESIPGLGTIPTLETDIGALAEGGVSQPIPLADGYLVARLTRTVPPRPAEFSEVKESVTRDMQNERKEAVLDSIDARFRAAIRAGADCESLFVPLGGLRVSRFFGRRGPIPDVARDSLLARDSTLYNEVFSSKPGATLRPRRGSLGTLYAVVDSLQVPPPARFAEMRIELRREMIEERSAAWTARLRSRATIQIFRKDLVSGP